ncbi:hypothetical protein GCM10028812_08730 [Ancylobacter sonchi]
MAGADLTASINALPKDAQNLLPAMEARFGRLADWVLSLHGVVTDAPSRVRLLHVAEQAATDAAWRMERAAAHLGPSPPPVPFLHRA